VLKKKIEEEDCGVDEEDRGCEEELKKKDRGR